MNDDAENKFPRSKDGDVAIHLSFTEHFQLHSQVLKHHSTFFDEEFKEPGAKLNAKARRDGAAAYRFDLVKDSQDDVGRLQRREVSESGKVKGGSIFPLDVSSASPSTSTSRHWTLLLAFFYGHQPSFTSDNVGTLLTDCDTFMRVAALLGSESHGVREVVDLALLRNDKIIWESVAARPRVWAGLARRIHSPTIYREAVVHLVGGWRAMDAFERRAVEGDEELSGVVGERVAVLENVKEAIELRVLGHYPERMVRDVKERPGRTVYAGDIYMWMALGFFRQWYAQAVVEGRGRGREDGGCAFYRLLGGLGEKGYLGKGDLGEFHQYFPMTAKAAGVLEGCLAELKRDVEGFVSGLLVNRSHLPEGKVPWLTCADIKKEDLPWEKEEAAERGRGEDLLGELLDGNVEDSDVEMAEDKDGTGGGVKAEEALDVGDVKCKGKGKQGTGHNHVLSHGGEWWKGVSWGDRC